MRVPTCSPPVSTPWAPNHTMATVVPFITMSMMGMSSAMQRLVKM